MKECEKIDFVIPWVDGSDEKWQTEKAEYSSSKNIDVGNYRYRDMSLLPYWFRGVENFAPWANKIHFITYGHLPKWLNLKHPKLNIVKHSDYIPEEYLPTFNSNTIILNIHKIPNLAENLVFFNDDVFLIKNMKPEDFFINNIPCDLALMRNFTPDSKHFSKIIFNMIAIINKHFNKHEVIKKNFFKWFNPIYGLRSCFINWQNYRQIKFSDIVTQHVSMSYKKAEFEYVWQLEKEVLHKTCLHKFRDAEDVTEWLVRYFRLMKGEFKPHPNTGKYFNLSSSNVLEICNAIKKQKYKQICVNDGAAIGNANFEKIVKEINNAFEIILPQKSEFEI